MAAAEGLSVAPDCEDALIQTSGGDMRKAITYLQSASQVRLVVAVSYFCVDDFLARATQAIRLTSFPNLPFAIFLLFLTHPFPAQHTQTTS